MLVIFAEGAPLADALGVAGERKLGLDGGGRSGGGKQQGSDHKLFS
jgi:hypothetical protein